MKGRWKDVLKKCWPPRKDQLLILILLGLLLAVIAIPTEEKKQTEKADEPDETLDTELPTDYETRMEQRLEELLSQVEGMGRVRVMLTFEGTGEKQVEKDEQFTADSSTEETIYEENEDNGKIPYVTAETNPQVEGVLVIAEGGGNAYIKQEIIEAAQALFGIDAHKIKIMKMEGTM